MFRFLSFSAGSSRQQSLVKGVLVLAGALLLLWLIIWLFPGSEPPPVTSDEAGTVAVQTDGTSLQVFTPGRVFVALLLAGGLGWAVYLRRRSGDTLSSPAPMQSIGALSISQDQQLRLVCCQDEVLLLGISPGDITLLRTYPRAAFAERVEAPDGPAALPHDPPIARDGASFAKFTDILRQYTNNGRHA